MLGAPGLSAHAQLVCKPMASASKGTGCSCYLIFIELADELLNELRKVVINLCELQILLQKIQKRASNFVQALLVRDALLLAVVG